MSADHDDLKILPEAVRKLEDDIFIIKEHLANELVAEGKRNVAVFSDAQTARIEQIITTAIALLLGSDAFSARVTKEVKFIAGSASLRFWLYLAGAFFTGALSVLIGLWLKAH
jgi:hypothetical protein